MFKLHKEQKLKQSFRSVTGTSVGQVEAGSTVGDLFQVQNIVDSKQDLVLLAIKDHPAF